MPAVDSESMAVADVYAESLLAVACEQRQEDEVAAELADLVVYMDREAGFALFLTSRSIDDDTRRVSLEKLFRSKMNDLLLNLLQVLNRRGRCDLVRSVARCVEIRMQAKKRQQEVHVETATPLTGELRGKIKKDISERIGAEALLIEKVSPDLIGGVVIRAGDEQIDASVASCLRSMRERLVERGIEEIHSGRGYEG